METCLRAISGSGRNINLNNNHLWTQKFCTFTKTISKNYFNRVIQKFCKLWDQICNVPLHWRLEDLLLPFSLHFSCSQSCTWLWSRGTDVQVQAELPFSTHSCMQAEEGLVLCRTAGTHTRGSSFPFPLLSAVGYHQKHYRHRALRPLRQFDVQNTLGPKDAVSSCWKRWGVWAVQTSVMLVCCSILF